MENDKPEAQLLVDRGTLDYINMYLSNDIENTGDGDVRVFLIEEVGLTEKLADNVMVYVDDFRRNPFMELGQDLVPRPIGMPGQRRRDKRRQT